MMLKRIQDVEVCDATGDAMKDNYRVQKVIFSRQQNTYQ